MNGLYTVVIAVQDPQGTEVFVKVFDCEEEELVKAGYATPTGSTVLEAIERRVFE